MRFAMWTVLLISSVLVGTALASHTHIGVGIYERGDRGVGGLSDPYGRNEYDYGYTRGQFCDFCRSASTENSVQRARLSERFRARHRVPGFGDVISVMEGFQCWLGADGTSFEGNIQKPLRSSLGRGRVSLKLFHFRFAQAAAFFSEVTGDGFKRAFGGEKRSQKRFFSRIFLSETS